jgi:hypothetical protein
MSNLIYVCRRDSIAPFGGGDLGRVADRITPAILPRRPHRILEGQGEALCITSPHGSAGVEGMSAYLGIFSGPCDGWQVPGSPVPDGSFALIRSQAPVTELCSDFSGTRTLWYALTDQHFFASTSQRALVCLLGDLAFNRGALAWFLSSGTLGPTDSWDARIQRLPGGARLVLDRAAWSVRVHTEPVVFEPGRMSAAEAQESLHTILWKAIHECRFQTPQWILPLSGGYDSRILLSALYEGGLRPRTVTWGRAASRSQKGNDAFVARDLAAHYGLVNDYLLTEQSGAAPRDVVQAFLAAHGGTTDALFPYLDGLKLWAGFAAEGVGGIIRGDEGFGTRVRPMTHHRHAQDLVLLREFLGEETGERIGDGKQVLPADLLPRPGESEQAYGDRLIHAFFIPVTLASLTDVKTPFVEIANPMLAGSVMRFVRQMPDALRAGRNLYERLTRSVSPPIPFATLDADDSRNGFLGTRPFRAWIQEELQGDLADEALPGPFREDLLALMRRDPVVSMDGRSTKALLKRIIPKSWIASLQVRRKPPVPGLETLAFRFALAAQLRTLLREDGRLFGNRD